MMDIWTAFLLAALCASVLVWIAALLHERKVDPLRRLATLCRRPAVELAVLAAVAVGLIQHGATKSTNGVPDRADGHAPPALRDTPSILEGEPYRTILDGELVHEADPPVDFIVTDLCFTAISPAETSVFVSAAWPTNWMLPLSLLSIYARQDLSVGGWEMIADVPVPTGAEAVDIEIPHNMLPEGGVSRAFFALGTYDDTDGDGIPDAEELLIHGTDPESADSDGDGISDGDEIALGTNPLSSDTDGDGFSDGEERGSITVLPQFEWYDMSTFPPVFNYPSGGGGLEPYSGAGTTLYSMSHTVLFGVECRSLTAFENGYVALSAPGDFNGWVFPAYPGSLSEDAFNSGSFLIAPYWSHQWVRYNDATSYLKAGSLPANGVTVVEFRNVEKYGCGNMTMQVIIPAGTGDVVRVSYLSSDFPLDGSDAIVGIQNRHHISSNGYYNLEWDFAARGSIPVGCTVEYRFGLGTDPLSADSDGDGLSDPDEFLHGANPWNPDTDGDGLSDWSEVAIGTSPTIRDTDGDCLLDGWEVEHGLDPLSTMGDDGASGDPDGDGLTNLEEQTLETDPCDADTDNDGLSDASEVLIGTSLTLPDTDHDGLLDGLENSIGTNPLQPDTDGDGMNDGWENQYRNAVFYPAVRNAPEGVPMRSAPVNVDFNPLVDNATDDDPNNDLGADPEGDGLTNGQECEWGTSPVNPDTDGDCISDSDEGKLWRGAFPVGRKGGDTVTMTRRLGRTATRKTQATTTNPTPSALSSSHLATTAKVNLKSTV